jgi:hypothetical protein
MEVTMRSADLLQALVADLNDHVFSRDFTATRAYVPLANLGELEALHVTVMPAGRIQALASRRTVQVDHRCEIAVQQRLASDAPEAVDPLLGVVEEIAEHLVAHRLGDAPAAEWVQTETSPLLVPEHFNELRQFTSLLAVTYRTWEAA